MSNKNAFHPKDKRSVANRCMSYIVYKFEQVWGEAGTAVFVCVCVGCPMRVAQLGSE